ncbi:hypothetical protein KR084_009792 [Drosophila pseudotakahashii]|nr:hypothetical protein KR084_009792 [Drosophila pseudotakahashii]
MWAKVNEQQQQEEQRQQQEERRRIMWQEAEKAHRRHLQEQAEVERLLKRAEEEERQLWEPPQAVPMTPRYTPEERGPRTVDPEDSWIPSPPRWIPEVPPTPRYEGAWEQGAPTEDVAEALEEVEKWRPARPPTPRFEQQRPQLELPQPQLQPQPQPEPQQQQPQPEPQQQQPQPEPPHQPSLEATFVRTDIPAAHVSNSMRQFVTEGVRWRQQTVIWTWPEGPAEDNEPPAETRIWEEAPQGNPRDPRRRGRPEVWTPPTPSTGPPTPPTPSTGPPTPAEVATERDGPLEKGPWVWPEPVASGRPRLLRQHSEPVTTTAAKRPMLMRQVSAPTSGEWQEVAQDEWPAGIMEEPEVMIARRKGGRRCVRVAMSDRVYRVRLCARDVRVFRQ